MPRPKGSKNKPKTGVSVRKPRQKKPVVNPLHVGKSTWVRPTHYYAIYFETKNNSEFFTYTEKEDGAKKLCDKLNSEGQKGRYVMRKKEYSYKIK